MARIIFRTDIPGIEELETSIITKHTADGGASPLTTLLAEQSINLPTDAATITAAKNAAAKAALERRQSENYFEKRALYFEPVFGRLRSGAQFLKSLKKGKVHELGDWGLDINGPKNRIDYPIIFEYRRDQVVKFYQKHLSYAPGTSPLQPFLDDNNINPVDELAATQEADTSNTMAQDAARSAETQQKDSDSRAAAVLQNQRTIGQYLIKLKTKNPKSVGDWGFTVDDSPRPPREVKSTVKPADKKIIEGIVIGSTFTNTGQTALHLYRGKTTTGTPIIVEVSGKIGMIKGFSSITVINPSTLVTGKFTTLQNI